MNWLYEKSENNHYRFVLGAVGKKPLVCFGINPSTAVPRCLDNTIRSVERITFNNGFDGWIMLNVYPQIATNPDDLHTSRKERIHSLNLFYIEEVFKRNNLIIWAAWGNLIGKREYLPNCLKDIIVLSNKYNCQWVTSGDVTVKGNPRHPLFLKQTTQLQDFDIDSYSCRNGIGG